MKNKMLFATMLVCIVLGSSLSMGINAPLHEIKTGTSAQELVIPITFPELDVTQDGNYLSLGMDNAFYLSHEGYPVMPYQTQVLKFPVGTKIERITVEISEEKIIDLPKKIVPATQPVVTNMKEIIKREHKEAEIYSSSDPYPSEWTSYHVGIGKDGKETTLFLTFRVFPARYIPSNNSLLCINHMDITVHYIPLKKSLTAKDTYDLIMIAPEEFAPDLQPLVNHKMNHGIQTLIATLDDIYGGTYFPVEGRDDAEKIKYFIKNALETWNITYVLLVGGRHGGVTKEKWWVPVRYASLRYDDEHKFLCDHYFADIYKYKEGEPVFDDWDSNENGLFGEWSFSKKDVIDMYPDVYVGRLACRNKFEVKIMVEKIITYESTAYGQPWTKTFVGVAGDTYPNDGDPYYEGELATAAAFDYLDDFEATYLWTSTGSLTSEQSIIDTLNQGCLFMHFSGHGNPMSWANHPPEDEDTWIGIDVTQFIKASNRDMYPITIVGGCHNSKYNVSLLNLLKFQQIKDIYYHSDWSPECWGWWLARKINGGSIATIANTGYGMGIPGEECLTGRGRYLEIQFFKSFSENIDMLGETYGTDLTYYLNAFPPMTDIIDNKIVLQWALLGDPSLKIGGYPP